MKGNYNWTFTRNSVIRKCKYDGYYISYSLVRFIIESNNQSNCVTLPSYTSLSRHDFYTHFLHFHLTMDILCFSKWLAIFTYITDFHRLNKRHMSVAPRKKPVFLTDFCSHFYIKILFRPFLIIFYIYFKLILLNSFFHNCTYVIYK